MSGAPTSLLKSAFKKGWDNKGNMFNFGTGLYFAAETYEDKRAEGSSKASAAMAAASDFVLPNLMSFKKYVGMELVMGAMENGVDAMVSANQYRRQLWRDSRQKAFSNSEFNDTEQVYTMRQAGMAIAQRSRYNTQHAMLGNEAKYMMK